MFNKQELLISALALVAQHCQASLMPSSWYTPLTHQECVKKSTMLEQVPELIEYHDHVDGSHLKCWEHLIDGSVWFEIKIDADAEESEDSDSELLRVKLYPRLDCLNTFQSGQESFDFTCDYQMPDP